MIVSSRSYELLAALLITSYFWADIARAQTIWLPVMDQSDKPTQLESEIKPVFTSEEIPQDKNSPNSLIWEPITHGINNSSTDVVTWSEDDNYQQSVDNPTRDDQQALGEYKTTKLSGSLQWPNGQIMSEDDQIYFRTAYSRGSMIQIGETVYPNLGYNALQRKPGTWVNFQISAIDDSWQSAPSPCKDGDFLDQCWEGHRADGAAGSDLAAVQDSIPQSHPCCRCGGPSHGTI